MTDIDVNKFNKLTKFIDDASDDYFDNLIFGGPVSDDNLNDPKMFIDFIKKYAKKYNDDASISKLIENGKFSDCFVDDWYYMAVGNASIYVSGIDEFIELVKDSLDGNSKAVVSDDDTNSLVSDILLRHKVYKEIGKIYQKTDFKKLDQEIDQFLKEHDINKIFNEPDKVSDEEKHTGKAVLSYLIEIDDKELRANFSKLYPAITQLFLDAYEPISELFANAYVMNYESHGLNK